MYSINSNERIPLHIFDTNNFPLADYSRDTYYVYEISPTPKWADVIYNTHHYSLLMCFLFVEVYVYKIDPEEIVYKLQ